MKKTLTEKIFEKHTTEEVKTGNFILCDIDIALANDITGPPAIREFEKMGNKKVFDKNKIALIPDHFTPNKDIASAKQAKILRNFSEKQEIKHYYEVGEMGIEHVILPEKGIVKPYDIIIGADSHTCTYGAISAFSTGVGSTDLAFGMSTGKAWFKVPSAIKINLTGKLNPFVSGKDVILYLIGQIGVDGALYKSLEWTGEGVSSLSMDDRFTIANMAIEAGAKNGIFEVDEKTLQYIKDAGVNTDFEILKADDDAEYENIINIDLSKLKPIVSFPHLPENTYTFNDNGELEPIGKATEKDFDVDKKNDKIKIDQVVIGSCTNGRISDMEKASEILKGKKIAKNMRLLIFPGSQKVYLESLEKGYIKNLIESGAAVSTPTCGPCLGGHMGILAESESCISTTNRNFVGRMGDTSSKIYLANPETAAASALTGYITDPKKLMKGKHGKSI